MADTLHILRSEPDETVAALVAALGGDQGTTVVCLYGDGLSKEPVDWDRLLEDIFNYEQVICWW